MALTLADANQIVQGALDKAKEMNIRISVAVCDAGGRLVAFSRMDGAVLGSIDIAVKKARTAALFRTSSEAVWDYCKPGAAAHALEHTNGGLAPFAAGRRARGDSRAPPATARHAPKAGVGG